MPNPKVNCPTCGNLSEWSRDNPWRPFCTERCKLIDLGEWADEKKRIPGESARVWEADLREEES